MRGNSVEVQSNRPHKVLYLQATSEIGGSDISLVRIIEKLDKTRFRPYALLPSDGPLVGKLQLQGCEVFLLKEMMKLTTRKGKLLYLRYLMNYPRAAWKLVKMIRSEHIDLVHTNSAHNLYGFLAAKLSGRPHVWHVREIVWQSKILRAVERFLLKHLTDRVVVTSDAVAGIIGNSRGSTPAHVRKIPNGIDTRLYHPGNDGRGVREQLGRATEVPLVGLVCRLDRWKGVETFLQAVALCHKECPEARFLIVGGEIEGGEAFAKELYRLADVLDLKDIVHFTGWRYQPEDMPGVHAALDLLVVASSAPEPFGLVLLEAMATGKPVVATDHGGPKEICVDGETALLVPPQDPQRMAEAILELLRNRERAREMGAAGRRRVEKLFDQRRCIRELELLYDELLGEAPSPAPSPPPGETDT